MVDLAELITNVIASGASDLHLSVGAPPVMRLNGELSASAYEPLTSQDTRELVYGLLTQDQRQRLETDLELDLSYAVPGPGPLPRERLLPAGVPRRRLPRGARRA